jgi:hypothetical protein
MLVLRPKGRGNWSPVTLQISDHTTLPRLMFNSGHGAPLLVRVGSTIHIGGVMFRVCEVRP